MARNGRPRKGSRYRWNRARVQALEKRLKDLQAKIDSGAIKVTYPTKKEQAEAQKAFHAKMVKSFFNNAKDIIEQKAPIMTLSGMVVAASKAKPMEAPKDLIEQICQSKEMEALLNKHALMRVVDSDEGRALAEVFPVVGRIWDALKAINEKRLEKMKPLLKFDGYINSFENKDMPITLMSEFLNAPTSAFAEALQEAQNQPPKSLNCKVTMQDMNDWYPIFEKYDIFACNHRKEEVLAAIGAEAQRRLRVKKMRLWAYFLDRLSVVGKIGAYWQDAYGRAKTFENSKGKPVSAKDFSKYLYTNDKGRWDEKRDSKIKPKARERMNFYQEIDEALMGI